MLSSVFLLFLCVVAGVYFCVAYIAAHLSLRPCECGYLCVCVCVCIVVRVRALVYDKKRQFSVENVFSSCCLLRVSCRFFHVVPFVLYSPLLLLLPPYSLTFFCCKCCCLYSPHYARVFRIRLLFELPLTHSCEQGTTTAQRTTTTTTTVNTQTMYLNVSPSGYVVVV